MKTYKEIIKKSILSWVVFWLTLFWVVYAANITTITTQTINSWDVIWAWWFQSVNDKLNNIPSCSSTVQIPIVNQINSRWSSRMFTNNDENCNWPDSVNLSFTCPLAAQNFTCTDVKNIHASNAQTWVKRSVTCNYSYKTICVN